MNKTLEEALDEIVYEASYKRRQNARRLSKIHKLKQENRVLASRRNRLMNKKIAQTHGFGQMSDVGLYIYSIKLNRISEQIGKNSAKILRLRTLIKQSKL